MGQDFEYHVLLKKNSLCIIIILISATCYLPFTSADTNMIRAEYDADMDGNLDTIATYTYDSNGNRLSQTTDSDGDGNTDSIRTYTYDSDNNTLSESFDNDADGMVDSINTYTYDSNGNKLT